MFYGTTNFVVLYGEKMLSKKSKIVCSVKVLGLEFVFYPLWTNYSQIFINCHVCNRGLQKQTEKLSCTVLLNVTKFLSSYFCVEYFLGI